MFTRWLKQNPSIWLVPLCAAFLAPLALGAAFHCDEFTVLRHVTRFADGDLGRPGRPGLLWLLLSPLVGLRDPVMIAFAARGAALVAAASCLLLVWLHGGRIAAEGDDDGDGDRAARRWLPGAAVVLLTTAAAWHGHSFEIRTDSFTTPGTLLLALLLWRRRPGLGRLLGLGVLVGALGLISQKSIYNVAAVSAGYLAWGAVQQGRPGARDALRALVQVGAVAVACVLAWYGAVAALSGTGAEFVQHNFGTAARTAFDGSRGLGARLQPLLGAIRQGLPLWLAGGVGVGLALRPALRGAAGPAGSDAPSRAAPPARPVLAAHPHAVALAVTTLCMLATVAVHRGVFLYYIASIEPLLAPLAGLGGVALVQGLAARRGPGAARVALVAVILAWSAWFLPRQAVMRAVTNEQQVELIREAGALFDEPVPYWDLLGMVAGQPETTFFGTQAVRRRFREQGGSTLFIELARERRPRFFLRNYASLDRWMTGPERRWHWRHFVPYRPNLYLLGARRLVHPDTADKAVTVEILVGGDYTVRFDGGWTGTADIDGEPLRHGQVVSLSEGRKQLRSTPTEGSGQLWLMLGEGRVPAAATVDEHIDWSLFPLASRTRYQQYDRADDDADLLTQERDPRLRADERRGWVEPGEGWPERRLRHRGARERRQRVLGAPRLPRSGAGSRPAGERK